MVFNAEERSKEFLKKKKSHTEPHKSLNMCLHKGGSVQGSGVTEDEIFSPWGAVGGMDGGSGVLVDEGIFLRQKRMTVSGKAAMSTHLTHNPI